MMGTSNSVAGGVKEKDTCSNMSFYGRVGRSEHTGLRNSTLDVWPGEGAVLTGRATRFYSRSSTCPCS